MSPLALALLAAIPPQEQAAPPAGAPAPVVPQPAPALSIPNPAPAPVASIQAPAPPADGTGPALAPSSAAPAPSTDPELSDPLADPAGQQVGTPIQPPSAGTISKLPDAARALDRASPAALVRSHPRHAKGDPLEGLNRRFFRINTGLDHAIFRPAALGYRHAVPRPVRSGLRNFFSNLAEPIVFINYVLQLKPGKAAETLGRFVVNSTVGLAGFVDVAKKPPFRLPHHDNGFGSTLGRYGVGPGPYLYLPFAGPTTLRDLLGGQVDRLVLPFTVQRPPFDQYEYQVPKAVITGLDARAEADEELKALYSGAVDPYATLRSVFLQNRAGEIEALRHPHRKAAPAKAADDEALADPLRDPATPATAPPPATDTVATPEAPPELGDPLTDPAAGPVPATLPAPEAPPPDAAAPAAPARR